MCLHAALATPHGNSSTGNIEAFERAQHESLPLARRQSADGCFEAVHRFRVFEFLFGRPADRVGRCRDDVIVFIVTTAARRPPETG